MADNFFAREYHSPVKVVHVQTSKAVTNTEIYTQIYLNECELRNCAIGDNDDFYLSKVDFTGVLPSFMSLSSIKVRKKKIFAFNSSDKLY